MKSLITKFEQTGICEVSTQKVVQAWNDKFSISKYHDRFTLVKQGKGDNCAKVQISTEQANEIITTLNLLPIQSSTFRNAKTYRSTKNIISEIKRFEDIKTQKEQEIQVLDSVISEYENALTNKE